MTPKHGSSTLSLFDWLNDDCYSLYTTESAQVVEVPSKPQGSLLWLKVAEYQPAGGQWQPTPNCWMQFEQEGLLLHEAKL